MIFVRSQYIILLWIIPFSLLVMTIGYYLRRRRLSRFSHRDMWPILFPSLSYTRRFWKRLLFILALICIIIAFLQPQYGLKIERKERKGQDIFIALDTSLSMLSSDIRPTRFHRAKQEIQGLIETLKGDRIGLIAFSGAAFVQCPLTTDYSALQLFLNDIKIGSVPTPGTDLATAIKTARVALNRQSKNKKKLLIIISDGESFENDPLESAKVAAKDGVTIFTIGIGTPEGEPIPLLNKSGQMTGFKKDKQGKIVVSKLNESLLKEVAKITQGQYIVSNTGPLAMDQLYRIISQLEKRVIQKQLRKQHIDRYYWFLIPAIFLLLLDLVLNERKKIQMQWKGRL